MVALLLLASAGDGGGEIPLVDLQLVLAVDCSYSVSQGEFRLQSLGLAKAFADRGVWQAIGKGKQRRIAVTVMQWNGASIQIAAIPWVVVDGRSAALELSERLLKMERLVPDGPTSISGAMGYASRLLDSSPYLSERRVIDISSDGRNNNGIGVSDIRLKLIARGVTINGLAILNEHRTLHYYFRQKIIGGENAFVVQASDYGDYVDAIRHKLLREIGPPAVTLRRPVAAFIDRG